MMLCPFCEGVTDTVVPGQTCTSPPRDRRSVAVSAPAVIDEPEARPLPATACGPAARTSATGCGTELRFKVGGAWNGDVGDSAGGFFPRCTTSLFPAAAHL